MQDPGQIQEFFQGSKKGYNHLNWAIYIRLSPKEGVPTPWICPWDQQELHVFVFAFFCRGKVMGRITIGSSCIYG